MQCCVCNVDSRSRLFKKCHCALAVGCLKVTLWLCHLALRADGRGASVPEANFAQTCVQAHIFHLRWCVHSCGMLRDTQLSRAVACGGVETAHLVDERSQLRGGVGELRRDCYRCAGPGCPYLYSRVAKADAVVVFTLAILSMF